MNDEHRLFPMGIDIKNSSGIHFGTITQNGRMHGLKVENSTNVTAQHYSHQIDAIGDLHQALANFGLTKEQSADLLRAVVLAGGGTDAPAVEAAMRSSNFERMLGTSESITAIANNAASFLAARRGSKRWYMESTYGLAPNRWPSLFFQTECQEAGMPASFSLSDSPCIWCKPSC